MKCALFCGNMTHFHVCIDVATIFCQKNKLFVLRGHLLFIKAGFQFSPTWYTSSERVQVWSSLGFRVWSRLAEHNFCRLWDIGTPLFSGATYISHPPFPFLWFPLQLSYSTTAIYIPLVKSVKSVEPSSQPDILLPFSSSRKESQKMTAPFFFSITYCYSLVASAGLLLQRPSKHSKVPVRLATHRNKQTSQQHMLIQTGSSGLLEQ